MSDLTIDEQVGLLLVRWNRIDKPRHFLWCDRIGPSRWMATAGIRRQAKTALVVRRDDFRTFRMWSIGVLWLEVWWVRQ